MSGARFEQRALVEYFRERVEKFQVELQWARNFYGSKEAPMGRHRWRRQKAEPMGRKMHQKEVLVKSVEGLVATVAPAVECKLSLEPVVHYMQH